MSESEQTYILLLVYCTYGCLFTKPISECMDYRWHRCAKLILHVYKHAAAELVVIFTLHFATVCSLNDNMKRMSFNSYPPYDAYQSYIIVPLYIYMHVTIVDSKQEPDIQLFKPMIKSIH